MARLSATLACICLVLLTIASAPAAIVPGGLTALPPDQSVGPDLVRNGTFEASSAGKPVDWTVGASYTLDPAGAYGGAASLRLTDAHLQRVVQNANQTVTLRKGIYRLSGWIRTANLGTNSTTGGIRLVLDFSRDGTLQRGLTAVVRGTRGWTYYEARNIVLPEDRTAIVRVEAYNRPNGSAWVDDVRLEEQLAHPLDVFLLYPNFRGVVFDDQPSTMRFDVKVVPPSGNFADFRVVGVVRDEATGTEVLRRDFAAAARFSAELDSAGLEYDRPYRVEFSLIDAGSGLTLVAFPAYRVSRAQAAERDAMTISFDAKNRILVRGVPRFVLGVYDAGIGYNNTDAYWESTLWSPAGNRRLEGLRFNLYLNYQFPRATLDGMHALMSSLDRRGVLYLQTGNCFQRRAAGTFNIDTSDAYVLDLSTNRALAGYYTADECDSSMVPGVFDQYQRLARLDPDSMTFGALLGSANVYRWRDAVDVLSTDPYPLYGAEPGIGYRHVQVADWTALTREAVMDARPFFTVLQFFRATADSRWVTRDEMRSHAVMALTEGARGLLWWSLGVNGLQDVCPDWCDEKVALMDNLRALVSDLADLEPAVLADDAPELLTGQLDPSTIRTKVKIVGGVAYVFAYNRSPNAVTETFTLARTAAGITVHGEARTITPDGARFSDGFAPYQGHVYVVTLGAMAPPPAPGVAVAFVSPDEAAGVIGTVDVDVMASGGDGALTLDVAIDGTPLATDAVDSAVMRYALDTTGLADGPHTLTATVTDGSGATATTSRSITVGNTPTLSPLAAGFTAPTAGATISGTATVGMSATGASGSATFELAIDGTVVSMQTPGSASATWAWSTVGVANGEHTLTLTVTDGAGRSTTATITVTVSNAPRPAPFVVEFTLPAEGSTVRGTKSVGMRTTSPWGVTKTWTLRLDGVVIYTVTNTGTTLWYQWPTTTAPNGPHTLTLTVTDREGFSVTATRNVIVGN